jgi:hypothetical protein
LIAANVIPAAVLVQLSSTGHLGPAIALLLALDFPLAYGGCDLLRQRRLERMAGIGVVGTLLTGGIGLKLLDAPWLAVKVAAVAGAIGLAVRVSVRTRCPVVRLRVFKRTLFDADRQLWSGTPTLRRCRRRPRYSGSGRAGRRRSSTSTSCRPARSSCTARPGSPYPCLVGLSGLSAFPSPSFRGLEIPVVVQRGRLVSPT